MRSDRPVAFGYGGVPLRPEVPDRGGIFDEKGEGVAVEQRQNARGVGANGIAHTWVEAIVDMREDEIEVGFAASGGFQFADPLLLHFACEGGAKFQESRAGDRKSTRLNSSHLGISYAVF